MYYIIAPYSKIYFSADWAKNLMGILKYRDMLGSWSDMAGESLREIVPLSMTFGPQFYNPTIQRTQGYQNEAVSTQVYCWCWIAITYKN